MKGRGRYLSISPPPGNLGELFSEVPESHLAQNSRLTRSSDGGAALLGGSSKEDFFSRQDVKDQQIEVWELCSNPVAPTIFRNEPFGENVEGLSHCGTKSCAVEGAVQTHDFENSAFLVKIRTKPFLTQAL